MRVTGGTGLMIPLHPADAKGVWPYRASFDEWDVLYTKNQFVQSAALKDDHTIQIVARGIASTDPVTVEMLVDGESKARQTVKATPRKGEVTAEFKGHFLQKGDAAAIPVGKVVKIVLHDRDAPRSRPISSLSPARNGTARRASSKARRRIRFWSPQTSPLPRTSGSILKPVC